MKRRNADCGKLRRPLKRNKITDSMYGSNTLMYMRFLLLWAIVITADFMLEFRFEFLWPFWLLLRSVHDSFKYKGLAFSVMFVCIAITSDMICLFFIPVHWLFFAASTYVWVQYVWHTDKGICLPTIILWMLFVYLEAAIRWKDNRHMPHLDLCRPFAAHCIGYPVVTLGFGFKRYVNYRLRQRTQRDIANANVFYLDLLKEALPKEEPPVLPIEPASSLVVNSSQTATCITEASTLGHASFGAAALMQPTAPSSGSSGSSSSSSSSSSTTNSIHTSKPATASMAIAHNTSTTSSTANGHATMPQSSSSAASSSSSSHSKPNRRSWDKDQPSKLDKNHTQLTTGGSSSSGSGSGSGSTTNATAVSAAASSTTSLPNGVKSGVVVATPHSNDGSDGKTSDRDAIQLHSQCNGLSKGSTAKEDRVDAATAAKQNASEHGGLSGCGGGTKDSSKGNSTSSACTADARASSASSATTTTTTAPPQMSHNNHHHNKSNGNIRTGVEALFETIDVVEKVKGRRNRPKTSKALHTDTSSTSHHNAANQQQQQHRDNHPSSNSSGSASPADAFNDSRGGGGSSGAGGGNAGGGAGANLSFAPLVCESCVRLEAELKRCKSISGHSKQLENELRQKSEALCAAKSSVQAKAKECEEVERKLQELQAARQSDRQTIQSTERRLTDERRQRQSLDALLNAERKNRKQAEEKASRSVECGEACKQRKQKLESDCQMLRRDLSAAEEAKELAEQQSRTFEQDIRQYETDYRSRELREHTEVFMSALAAMQDKNATLEKNLSAETRVKLDLFSALGEVKRQLEIRDNMARSKDKEILELKAKIAQLLAVMPTMPSDSFCMSTVPSTSTAGGNGGGGGGGVTSSMMRLNHDGSMIGSPVGSLGALHPTHSQASSPMAPHKSLGGSPLMGGAGGVPLHGIGVCSPVSSTAVVNNTTAVSMAQHLSHTPMVGHPQQQHSQHPHQLQQQQQQHQQAVVVASHQQPHHHHHQQQQQQQQPQQIQPPHPQHQQQHHHQQHMLQHQQQPPHQQQHLHQLQQQQQQMLQSPQSQLQQQHQLQHQLSSHQPIVQHQQLQQQLMLDQHQRAGSDLDPNARVYTPNKSGCGDDEPFDMQQ